MTRHLLTWARSALLGGVLLWVGAPSISTPSLKANRAEPRVLPTNDGIRPVRAHPIFEHEVALPSATFRTYVEGELVRVSIPSNWRELPGSNAVTFAPEGAYGSVGARSVFTHGIAMGLARNDRRNLRIATGDFIQSYVLVPRRSGLKFLFRRATISDRPGLHTVLSTVSEATREPERIAVFTTLLRDGTLLYVLAVAPRDCAPDYADTFRRVIESIQIMDCDHCVP